MIGIILTGLMLYDVLEGIIGIELSLGGFLTAFTYSILAGIMIGRIVGMRLKIKNILTSG